jgi:hypothetical protein
MLKLAFNAPYSSRSETGCEMWELRAMTSLVRVKINHQNRRKARGVLAPIYGWFGERRGHA